MCVIMLVGAGLLAGITYFKKWALPVDTSG